ncbi:MAG TPA: mechanosensitive ion channel domain-containing protein [Devosiaceae bacterium]|jgi:small conductance mechanosensitive channel|nr:mechanosensitive ion channel domain-containing protein [Devosiaceae bacterium]
MEIVELWTVSSEWALANMLNVVTALVVLVGGWYLSGVLSRGSRELLPKTRRVDNTIAPLLSQVVRYGVLIVTAVIVLSQFGVQTASILAVLGAAGLAIALALQGTLSNLASGILLIWLRPFNVGEYVDAEGVAGTVVEIGLFGTRLRTYDGIFVYAPNTKIWSSRIINYTRESTRMVETKIGIAYSADIAAARAALLEVATDERVLPDPAPFVFVDALGDSAVVLNLRSWVKGSEWWQANVDFREQAKLRLDAAGIEIPYNKLDLYLKKMPQVAPPAEDSGQAGA